MGGHVGGFGPRASGFCWGLCPFIWWCQEGPLGHSQNKLLISGPFSQGKVRLDFALPGSEFWVRLSVAAINL